MKSVKRLDGVTKFYRKGDFLNEKLKLVLRSYVLVLLFMDLAT